MLPAVAGDGSGHPKAQAPPSSPGQAASVCVIASAFNSASSRKSEEQLSVW